MNHFVAQTVDFSHASKQSTMLFFDRRQDMVTLLMHESTYHVMMTYEHLLQVKVDQVWHRAKTNSGTNYADGATTEKDKQWVGLRPHSHTAKVRAEILRSVIVSVHYQLQVRVRCIPWQVHTSVQKMAAGWQSRCSIANRLANSHNICPKQESPEPIFTSAALRSTSVHATYPRVTKVRRAAHAERHDR